MVRKFNFFGLLFFSIVLTFSSCKKEEDPPITEFVASDASFKDFRTWTLVAQKQGPDPALGAAHAGNDSTVTRYIYFKDDQNRVDGKYPIGTIIVKEAYNPEDTYHGYTAMVKRGNNFNASGGNWEWFVLAGDGQIATDEGGNQMRGANLMDGACVGCHSQAAGKDYSFAKP